MEPGTIPEGVGAFWRAFEAACGRPMSARFYEAAYFADTQPAADALAALVLAGTKRGTASSVLALEREGKRAPRPGDLSVVTLWSGEAVCVIETVAANSVPFEEVGAAFAAIEGEGDGSLRYWRQAHWAYYGRECLRLGLERSPRMPILCEEFRVVYRR